MISRIAYSKKISIFEIETKWSLNDVVYFTIMMDVEAAENQAMMKRAEAKRRR
jgi:hypothetical protein